MGEARGLRPVLGDGSRPWVDAAARRPLLDVVDWSALVDLTWTAWIDKRRLAAIVVAVDN